VSNDSISSSFASDELNKLGDMSREEKWVSTVFIVIGSLWLLNGFLPEFIANRLSDTFISMLGATSLFLLPSTKKKGKLLEWSDMGNLPWGILLLVGGGMSLAAACEGSKLTEWVGGDFSRLDGVR